MTAPLACRPKMTTLLWHSFISQGVKYLASNTFLYWSLENMPLTWIKQGVETAWTIRSFDAKHLPTTCASHHVHLRGHGRRSCVSLYTRQSISHSITKLPCIHCSFASQTNKHISNDTVPCTGTERIRRLICHPDSHSSQWVSMT
jgi:hypothetical protein